MSIIRKVFMSIIRCLGCGLVGYLGALILAVCVYFLVENVFAPRLDVDLMIIGIEICGTFVGFALGAIYGAIRTLTSLERRTVLIAMSVIGAIVLLVFVVFILSVALEPTPPPRPLKILPIAQQTIWVGKPLSILVSVEHAQKGSLRYSLGPSGAGGFAGVRSLFGIRCGGMPC